MYWRLEIMNDGYYCINSEDFLDVGVWDINHGDGLGIEGGGGISDGWTDR